MIKNKGLILIFLTALISGVSIFINSFGVKGFDSSVFTFSKNVIVSIFLFSIIMFIGKFDELKTITKKQWSKLVLIGFVGGSIPFLLFFKGLQLTTGTTSAFIHKTMILYVAVLAILFLKEKVTKPILFGVSLLLLGNYFMLRPSFDFSQGHLLILGATLFWATEQIISKHTLKELSGNVVAFGRMFFGSLFILIFLMFTQKTVLILSMSFEQYLWIIVTSLFLLGYVFTYYNGLKEVKVTTAVSILALGSPITTILAFVFNGGSISLFQLNGIILTLIGVISILWFSQISKKILQVLNIEKHGWN